MLSALIIARKSTRPFNQKYKFNYQGRQFTFRRTGRIIPRLHDRANIELAHAGLLKPRPWLKCGPRLIGCLHDLANVQQTSSKRPAPFMAANVQQTSSKRPALRLLEVCWTFAGSCKHLIRLLAHG